MTRYHVPEDRIKALVTLMSIAGSSLTYARMAKQLPRDYQTLT
jgi:hypothetical protein